LRRSIVKQVRSWNW